MNNKILFTILFAFCLNTNAIFAQHCGTCTSNIIALQPMYNNIIIDGLSIRLINTNNPWSTKLDKHLNGFYKVYNEHTKYFYKCTTANTSNEAKRKFYDFAKNDYVQIISNQSNKHDLFVIVEDTDGYENGGEFETVIITLDSFQTTNLCTNNIKTVAERNDYKPLKLDLIKKNNSNQEMQLPEFLINDNFYISSKLIKNYYNYQSLFQYIKVLPTKQSRDVAYECLFL